MDFGGFPDVADAGLSAELPPVGPALAAQINDAMVTRGRILMHKIITDVERRATNDKVTATTVAMHSLCTARVFGAGV